MKTSVVKFVVLVCALMAGSAAAMTDVLFLVDSTGSMEGLSNFQTAFNGIITAINTDSSCPESIMYSVADYKNYADGGHYQAYGVNLVQPFTYSAQEALSAIDGLSAGGGGDGPESQLKAMVSIASNWLTTSGDLGFNGRAGVRKILIWAGDAPGHIAGDSPAGYYPTLDATIDALTAQGIIVFALNATDCNSGLNALYNGHRQAGEITTATGGTLFCTIGSGGSNIEIPIVGAIMCFSFVKDDDLNDEDPQDCRSPEDEIVYTICWNNTTNQTFEDCWIVDYLNEGVDFPQGVYTFDPNMNLVPPDPGYDKATHSYTWEIGQIDPNTSDCVEPLTVVVNDKAQPGMKLHNYAELWGTIYDANHLNPQTVLIETATKDTLICCYDTTDPNIIFVDASATNGNRTGVDWQNSYTSLQSALDRARNSVCDGPFTIYIAQGTYDPNQAGNISFVLPDGCKTYGGFPAGGCDFSQRNPKRYETILTGLIDDEPVTRVDSVVVLGDETVLDGFVVTESSQDGQGVYGSSVDCSIANSILEKNLGYGAYFEDSNVEFTFSRVRDNLEDGIYHSGSGYTLTVENVWVQRSRRHGIFCSSSTPTVRNSNITESDMAEEGRAGVRMENPTNQPVFQNVTCAHNKTKGIERVGSGSLPSLQNCVIFHNGGPQLSGFTADDAAWYSSIQDCNEVNYNINDDPEFVYFDPNNVRISTTSPCKDTGNPLLNYDNQVDMDSRERVLGTYADRGAYEVIPDCQSDSHELDLNHDGVFNLDEFRRLSLAWLGHDPNDPAWIQDPNLIDPDLSEGWYEWKYVWNLDATGDSQYQIDLADLIAFAEDVPWLWRACWFDLEQQQMQQMMAPGGEEWNAGFQPALLDSASKMPAFLSVEEKSIPEQILELANAIDFLEQIWLEDPCVQQEIDADDWQRFMDSVYQNLLDLQTEAIQNE